MDKLKFRRSGIQARVLALTMFFTLGASLVIAASNMHQMTAEWERTTILNAEYALQTWTPELLQNCWRHIRNMQLSFRILLILKIP